MLCLTLMIWLLYRGTKSKNGSFKQPSSAGLISSTPALAEQCSTSTELSSNPTVLVYVRQLDDHRKKCELSGRCDELLTAVWNTSRGLEPRHHVLVLG